MSLRTFCFLLLFSLVITVPALAQLSTGSIAGTVQDPSGAIIPGVTVTLSNPGTIGGNQQTVTSERGTYQFTRLVPGRYSVKAELPGFRPAQLENLVVNADVTVRADLSLQVGEITDAVTVTGESPLLDTTSALNQAVLDRATLDKLPTGHDLWSIGRMVPGVVPGNYDVGGNQSFQQSTPTVHGSSGTDNKYAIDGMDVAWAGGAGTVMVYFDPNMFEEVNYQVGNISAENRQGGVVMNMVTKTGTNNLHGSFMFTGTKASLIGNNISPELGTLLKKQIPAIVINANPDIKPGQQIQSLFDTAASLSGPVIKDKLWFTGTYKISSLNQYVLGNYNPNGTQGLDDNRIINGTFKLSYQLNPKSQLHYTYSRNLKYRYHRRTSTYQEDAASRFQDQWADIHQLKWTDTVSSRIVTDAGVSLQVGPSPYLPKAEALANAAAGLFPKNDQSTGASTVMNNGYNTQPQYRGAANFNLSYFAGRHEVKFGYQFSRLMLRSETWSIVNYPDLPGIAFSARYSNGNPNAVLLYNYPADSRVFSQEHGFFVQDKWTVSRKLTVNTGIRFDHVNAWVPPLCQPETPVVAGQCFSELKDPAIPKLFNMAPRLGFIYDLFGDGRTAIKGSANVYHIGIDSGYPNRVNPYSTATNTVTWSDANKDLKPQMNELAAFDFTTKKCVVPVPTGLSCTGFSFGNTNVYDPNLKRPYSVEFSIGLQRELRGGFVVAGTYYRRDTWRNIGSVNTALSEASYDPINVTIPQNNQQITIYNIKSSLQTLTTCTGIPACIYWSNHSDRGEYFNGLDLTVNRRMSNHFMLSGDLSFNSDQLRVPYRSDNPNLNLFPGGPASNNVPVEFKASGVYQAPFDFEVAANFQSFSGKPENETYQITRSLVPQLTGTTLTVNLGENGITSLPAVRMLDLSIGREFRFGEGKLRLSPKMEFFNLNNSSAIQGRSNLLSGTNANAYLNPSSILNPRMLRLGLQMNY
jgi:Carboxypeptidase regulatory-like domain/TonB dependent receptor-like, beta-barrel/TonB-dependent Receptor Plug Domain